MGAATSQPVSMLLNVGKKNRSRLTSWSVNALCVLAFLTVGDGGAETQRVAGFLDLPRNASVEKSIFSQMEQQIAPVVKEPVNELPFNNLCSEVKATCEDDTSFDCDGWKTAVLTEDASFPDTKGPHIGGGNDASWQNTAVAEDMTLTPVIQ